MCDRAIVRIGNRDLVQDSLGDHVAIDTVGRQVLHVTIEQAGALAVQHAVAVANDGPHRRTRSLERPIAHTLLAGPQVFMDVRVIAPRLDLAWAGEMLVRELGSIWMAR